MREKPKTSRWTIARSIGCLLLLFTMSSALVAAYYSIDKHDAFFISAAELKNPIHRLSPPSTSHDKTGNPAERFGFEAHHISPGFGTVFGYRFHSIGETNMIDDEHYLKITIWVAPTFQHASVYTLGESDNVHAIYSYGGSAWPRRDCSGEIRRGILDIKRIGRGYRVSIRGEIEPQIDPRPQNRCSRRVVEKEFFATRIGHSHLTPWLGRPGAHPYDETYR